MNDTLARIAADIREFSALALRERPNRANNQPLLLSSITKLDSWGQLKSFRSKLLTDVIILQQESYRYCILNSRSRPLADFSTVILTSQNTSASARSTISVQTFKDLPSLSIYIIIESIGFVIGNKGLAGAFTVYIDYFKYI